MISGPTWDPRRNTSRVWPVPPHAIKDALRALASLRREQPALVAWLESGAPTLTHAEHLERFGEPYRGVRARRHTRSGDPA